MSYSPTSTGSSIIGPSSPIASNSSLWTSISRYIGRRVENLTEKWQIPVEKIAKEVGALPPELRHLIWSYIISIEEMARLYLYRRWDSEESVMAKNFFSFVENKASSISNHTQLDFRDIQHMYKMHIQRFQRFGTDWTCWTDKYHHIAKNIPITKSGCTAARIRLAIMGLLSFGSSCAIAVAYAGTSNSFFSSCAVLCCGLPLFPIVNRAINLSRNPEKECTEKKRDNSGKVDVTCGHPEFHLERYFEAIDGDTESFKSGCRQLRLKPLGGHFIRGLTTLNGRPIGSLNLSLNKQDAEQFFTYEHKYNAEYLAKFCRVRNSYRFYRHK